MKSSLLLSSLFLAGAAAQAAVLVTTATLDGPSEAPPNASPGIGAAKVTYDSAAQTLLVEVTFSGLLAGNTAAHIHGPTATPGAGTAGVATTTPTFTGFPTGATSGSYVNLFDLTLASSFNPAFVTANGGIAGAETALAAALASGRAYLNIHSSLFPGGEIRGFLNVPEPAATASIGAGGWSLRLHSAAQGRKPAVTWRRRRNRRSRIFPCCPQPRFDWSSCRSG